MKKINILDNNLVNLISAGEVIERPSSVLKELVENSIDAKASEIIIKIFGNGTDKIIVSDNGSGISEDDLELAVKNHATSKIKLEKDLDNIISLGFRGEALASISSVSILEIISKTKNNKCFRVKFQESKLIEKEETSGNVGTTVIVNNLFYNTPARLKYLKSDSIEKKSLMEIFNVLAISNPSISFKLYYDDKLIKETYGKNDDYDLISNIFNNDYINDITIFEEDIYNNKIKFYLFDPKIVRSNKNDIYVFVNDRYVTNYLLKDAVLKGYQDFIMTKKYPVAIIKIYVDNKLVDVNCHPQKLEVKLANEYALKAYITGIIKNKLLEINKNKLNSNLNILNGNKHFDYKNINDEKKEINKNYYESNDNLFKETEEYIELNEEVDVNYFFNYTYIGQFNGTYLLFQDSNNLYVIDQHAASERIRYEKILKNKSSFSSINLLISIKLDLSNFDFEKVKEKMIELNEMGFSFNENLEVISYPSYLKEKEVEIAVLDYISNVSLDYYDNWLKQISCKGAIKANHYLTNNEAISLFKDLLKTKNYMHCIHGRPTIIKYDISYFEKLFKRIV